MECRSAVGSKAIVAVRDYLASTEANTELIKAFVTSLLDAENNYFIYAEVDDDRKVVCLDLILSTSSSLIA